MRDLTFIDCGPEAAQQAELWAGAALARAGVAEAAAGRAAARLADGVREAMTALRAEGGARPAQAMLLLSDEHGPLSFELIADGLLPHNAAILGDTSWTDGEMRAAAAGDGASWLEMAAAA